MSTAELERLLAEVRALLPPASYALIESLLRTLVWIMGLLEQKQTTIARLRRLIFGEKTEKGPEDLSRCFPGRGGLRRAQTQSAKVTDAKEPKTIAERAG